VKNIEFLKKEFEKDSKNTQKSIDKLYKEAYKLSKNLPNDCLNIIIDGEKCENNDYKIDILTNLYHQIGYLECLKYQSKNVLYILGMNDIEFNNYLINQQKIKKQNEKTTKEFKKKLNEIIKNKY